MSMLNLICKQSIKKIYLKYIILYYNIDNLNILCTTVIALIKKPVYLKYTGIYRLIKISFKIIYAYITAQKYLYRYFFKL